MNGHGIIFCPPGELIECNFINNKINDGKIKILVISKYFYQSIVFKWRVL